MSVDWPLCHVDLPQDEEVSADINASVLGILSGLSVEQKVGQLIQAELASITPAEVQKNGLGSILNGGGVYPHGNKNATIRDWYELAFAFYTASSKSSSGIPVLWGTDAVHGHNNVKGATLFPHNVGLGATRDPELLRCIGEETARDLVSTGIRWTFAPTLAVPRDYRWGRCYEGFSQDPKLVAMMGAAMVEGLQGRGCTEDYLGTQRVLATSKHFIGEGATAEGIDQGEVNCSEDTLRQLHSCGHVAALRAGAQVVMAAFNSVWGTKVHASKRLLTDVLKNRMGFQGFVISDWDGFAQIHSDLKESIVASINAGVDVLMVSSDWSAVRRLLIEAIEDRQISESRLDDAVCRILRVKALLGYLPDCKTFEPMPPPSEVNDLARDSAKEVARSAVRQSLVLIKNEKQLLPLERRQRIAIVGRHVEDIASQCGGWSISWQGDGNTNEDFPNATSIVSGIRSVVEEAGGSVELTEEVYDELHADCAIVLFGESPYAEGEGDINHLSFSAQDSHPLDQLRRLKSLRIPTVALFLSGRPRWVNPELNASSAFVACWLPGTEGEGVSDVIFKNEERQINYHFQGKLGYSWPLQSTETKVDEESSEPENYLPVGYGLRYGDESAIGSLDEKDNTTLPVIRGWNKTGSYNYPR